MGYIRNPSSRGIPIYSQSSFGNSVWQSPTFSGRLILLVTQQPCLRQLPTRMRQGFDNSRCKPLELEIFLLSAQSTYRSEYGELERIPRLYFVIFSQLTATDNLQQRLANLSLRFSKNTYGFRCQFEHSFSLNLKQVVFPKPGLELLSLSPYSRPRITRTSQVEADSLSAVVSCGEHAYALDFLFWRLWFQDRIYFSTVH